VRDYLDENVDLVVVSDEVTARQQFGCRGDGQRVGVQVAADAGVQNLLGGPHQRARHFTDPVIPACPRVVFFQISHRFLLDFNFTPFLYIYFCQFSLA